MTVSSIFLTSGMRENLFSLQNTESLMEKTQTRLATGLKVNSALDDPINFFAAQAHRQRAGDLAVLKDAMNEGIQTIKAADAGIEGITALLAQARTIIDTARTAAPADIDGLEAQWTNLLGQIDDMATDSNYKGTNLLADDTLTVNFNESGLSYVDVDGFDASAIAGLLMTDFTDFEISTELDTHITEIDAALSTLRTNAKTLSSNLSVITTRFDFTSNIVNTLNTGADNLTLADMNEESANMLMLQTRQSLATSSLSIASDAAQAVLRLF